MRQQPIIAIDGPAGSGKTTIAKGVSKELGFTYIDTGAMYRCVALAADRDRLPTGESPELQNLLDRLSVVFVMSPSKQIVILNGDDVSDEIRRHDLSNKASDFSRLPMVRRKLVEMQREMACDGGVVMEGRDIGTNVFPDAELKVFLTATPEVRAKRRFLELASKGQEIAYETILADQIERDKNDSTRSLNPLVCAPDGWPIDTSDLSIADIIDRISVKARKIMERSKTGA
jgi:CMP/dCMP kinase